MQISVTHDDIAAWDALDGFLFRCTHCPIARALHRTFPKATVTETYAYLNDADRTRLRLPLTASQFIRAFDAGAPVQPFVFELGGE